MKIFLLLLIAVLINQAKTELAMDMDRIKAHVVALNKEKSDHMWNALNKNKVKGDLDDDNDLSLSEATISVGSTNEYHLRIVIEKLRQFSNLWSGNYLGDGDSKYLSSAGSSEVHSCVDIDMTGISGANPFTRYLAASSDTLTLMRRFKQALIAYGSDISAQLTNDNRLKRMDYQRADDPDTIHANEAKNSYDAVSKDSCFGVGLNAGDLGPVKISEWRFDDNFLYFEVDGVDFMGPNNTDGFMKPKRSEKTPNGERNTQVGDSFTTAPADGHNYIDRTWKCVLDESGQTGENRWCQCMTNFVANSLNRAKFTSDNMRIINGVSTDIIYEDNDTEENSLWFVVHRGDFEEHIVGANSAGSSWCDVYDKLHGVDILAEGCPMPGVVVEEEPTPDCVDEEHCNPDILQCDKIYRQVQEMDESLTISVSFKTCMKEQVQANSLFKVQYFCAYDAYTTRGGDRVEPKDDNDNDCGDDEECQLKWYKKHGHAVTLSELTDPESAQKQANDSMNQLYDRDMASVDDDTGALQTYEKRNSPDGGAEYNNNEENAENLQPQ